MDLEIDPNGGSQSATDRAVGDRYGAAALEREAALCCPVDYDARYLKAIPDEVIERDYGCGDPSRYVRTGDRVLDLGSGGGKICFIASQIVGPEGCVIGIDRTDDMLELARRAAPQLAERIGYANVEFRRGRIEDLALDLDRVDAWLDRHPVRDLDGMEQLDAFQDRLRAREPMVPDASIDIVVSNCVLNLVHEDSKPQLIREIFRVLKRGGRIAISDIVSDEVVPAALKADPELFSGCISGAFHERELLRELAAAGFHGIAIDKWEPEPFAIVEGIEFRSVTVTAHKGKQGECLEGNRAVVYAGPWKRVEDDDGHCFERGARVAVCDKTYDLLTREPYANQTIGILPAAPVPDAERADFDCGRDELRHPRESKAGEVPANKLPGDEGSCC